MKTSQVKQHVSNWTAIHVLKVGEPLRIYALDRTGRLNPADIPRNPRRALADRSRLPTISEAPEQSLAPVSESEDPFIALDLPSVNWDSMPEIADMPLVELGQLKGIEEECFFC
jgi:hypothetical protein